jgi:thiol-disulfide isomerase/thioredoxin
LWGDSTPPAEELTPAEQELVTLMTEYYEELNSYWQAERKFKTEQEYQAALDDESFVDPNAEFIPRLLDFEAAHRGEDVGLLALKHVFSEAARGGPHDGPCAVGRREACGRLFAYDDSPFLAYVARGSLHGRFEPAAYDALTSLVKSDSLPQPIGDQLRFAIASKDLELQNSPYAGIAERIAELENGAEPQRPGELEWLRDLLERTPPTEEMTVRLQAALATLEQLAADETSPVLRRLEGIDDKWYVVRLVDDPEPRRLADQAAALLFKDRHLKVGAVAPNLEATLLDGRSWRMTDQRGKVVVLQFSFTGCGPCAAMYPDLADLTEEYGDRLEVLTLMRDDTAELAQESVDSGKMTWSVSLDGKPGSITRRWSVDSFPTVYLIDRNGKISARNLRGDDLREEVARLLNADG